MKSTVYWIFLIVWLAAVGCGDAPEPEIPAPEPEPEPPIEQPSEQPSRFPPLEGTDWKLAGIVDASTGDVRELEPKDCATCYTLSFDTDSTAEGKVIVNTINISLADSYANGVLLVKTTKIYLSGEDDFYLAIEGGIYSYEYLAGWSSGDVSGKKELRFYNKEKDYLLYKLVQP
jgi:hypothetical protein